MNNRKYFIAFLLIPFGTLLINCSSKNERQHVAFTKADSLTEIYLNLQDSMISTWNRMINDDNQKIRAMENLLHELSVGGQFDPERIQSLENRLTQLKRIRYTPKTMANADVIEEYDFACNSIVSELISMTESHPAFGYNKVLQNLVEKIRASDQRVALYREDYDQITRRYNQFLEKNKKYISEIEDQPVEKKPLFHMVSE